MVPESTATISLMMSSIQSTQLVDVLAEAHMAREFMMMVSVHLPPPGDLEDTSLSLIGLLELILPSNQLQRQKGQPQIPKVTLLALILSPKQALSLILMMVSTILTLALLTTPLRTIQPLHKDHHMASQIAILYLHQRPLPSVTTPLVRDLTQLIPIQRQMDLLILSSVSIFRVFTPAINTLITNVTTLESLMEHVKKISILISPNISSRKRITSYRLFRWTQILMELDWDHTNPTSQNGELLTSTHSLENENIS